VRIIFLSQKDLLKINNNQNPHIMKTNIFKLFIILLFLGGFTTIQAQGLFNLATLDEEADHQPLNWTGDDPYNQKLLEKGVEWADYTVGGGAGFGWSDNDGNSATSLCVSAEFLAKVTGEDQNSKGAGYLGAFGTYHNTSGDGFNENLTKAGVKFSYFDPIAAFNKAQLIYGVKAFIETGSRDFSGFKDDVTGYGASVYAGVNFRINNKVSIGVEAPVLSYLSRTIDANGTEFKADSFSAAINKDNPVMATVRFNLIDKIRGFKFVSD